ncbi:MAG: chemotaxis protein CheB [Bacteroidota bacterium]
MNEPHHIIAIGASAGGLEEINSFFDHTPLDGVAYVIIQHLSPDFKSRMVELLAKHSKLKVSEAVNAQDVECNQVYLIPNDKFMTISNNKLYLTDKEKVHGPHLTINTFFNSLAVDSGNKSIGVILSGLGTDGTEGVKAIKRAGGMVIARTPETSAFAGMPTSAIAAGVVDHILEPVQMPDVIDKYVQHDLEISPDNKEEEKNMAAIIVLIKEQLPLDFSDYKQSTIYRRIKRRAVFNNYYKLENYLEYLKATPEEVEALAKDFLISVTAFFRDAPAFEFIQNEVLPEIIKGLAPEEELKLWVAGCATGEEAYSLAILVHEQLKEHSLDNEVKIFATDIDTAALVYAGKGVYTAGVVKDISADRLEKYFVKEGGHHKVITDIRKMVIFAHHDLVKNPPYCNMHFISCRNLLIYMTPALQKKIFSMLLFGLKMDGYLFLGSSENPMPIIQNLEVINKKWKIYKNLQTNRQVRFDTFSLPELPHIKSTPSAFLREDILPNSSSSMAEAMNTILLTQMDCLAVCIDENNHVVRSYGDTSKYLLQKNFNLNLAELLPAQLAVAFNALSIKALKSNEKFSVSGIKIMHKDVVIEVSVSVSPLLIKKGEHRLLLVIFNEDIHLATAQKGSVVFDEKIYLDQYTKNLEEELKELKDKLYYAYEKLDASNENMQSFNEELVAANEEMQSTNEEMQSVNEELHTINADYQLKNKELHEVNDDLNNYFRSNINGQLFVNNDLMLVKFSPGTVKQINLLPSDIGRPLSNISTNIKLETIAGDIQQVLKDGSIITKEIETNNGKWYQVMTMPYLQQLENKRNGAVVTFNDITELKMAQSELDKKNASLQRINADLDNFVNVASHDLLAPLSNIEMSINYMNEIKVLDPELNGFLKIINTSVKKFRSLINEMASIGKMESDEIEVEMVDVIEILDNVEWSLENRIKSSGAVINRNLKVNHISFSKKNLRSIMYNLISNSIKFKTDISPVININISKEPQNIIISVQDNGIGMDKSDIDKIFTMYGRIHNDVEGHGIGLYLAKKIVDAAGGNIVVESKVGYGSKFIITLQT